MSVVQKITWRSLPIETYNQFTATFNAFGLGQYSFTGVAANVRQLALNMQRQYVYLIDRVSFSASIDEGVYLSAAQPTPNNPQFRFFFRNTSYNIYPFALPAINYKDNLEWCFWFRSPKGADSLQVSLNGILNQVPAIVGTATITVQLSLVIYQEMNAETIREMLGVTSKQFGNFYSGRIPRRELAGVLSG